ncbi:right-handed parallel beta-helix repeat-containing protein [Streptomyces pactum]|uniref:right-handed parallel beta-helix repeat-containing protein n=1 Tax=Streptomyces pactum TaxID=68249 RepID=UPI0036FC3648
MYIRHLRHVAPLATLAVLEAALVPAAASATPDHHPARHTVRPGQSIQAAVDAARPGDTVLVLPGVYRESVHITVSGLTLRGSGRATVLMPPGSGSGPGSDGRTGSDVRKDPDGSPGSGARKESDSRKDSGTRKDSEARKESGGRTGGAAAGTGRGTAATPRNGGGAKAKTCAAAGHGICVTGTERRPVDDVAIRTLTVSGFRGDGIRGNRTDRMSVHGVRAVHNGRHGISQERSVRGDLRGNEARHNAESGIFLANMTDAEGGALDTRGAVIKSNKLSGNRIGVVLRRTRNLTVERNTVNDNCGGVFVVGDESTPRGGALTITRNTVHHNNRHCPATARLPIIEGTGILLTGVEETRVTDNEVRGHTGSSPMSGGVVLFKSMTGAPNARNTVSGNEVRGNTPADLADQDRGPGNAFTGNRCDRSVPQGWC